MSNSNEVSLAIWEESTFGVLPVTQPLKSVRFNSESLVGRTGSVRSQEIRADRRTANIIRTQVSAGGSIESEFCFGSAAGTSSAQDLLIEAALQSADFAGLQTNTGTYTATSGVISVSAGTNPETGVDVGELVRLKNSAGTPQLLGYYLVTAVNAGSHTITVTPSLSGSVTEIEVGQYITDGTTKRSFSIEKEFNDLSSVFHQYSGMNVDGWSLNLRPGTIDTQSFTLMGKRMIPASATVGDGSNVAHVTSEPMNAVDHVYALRENHVVLSSIVSGISLSVSNNMFAREAIGNLGPVSMGSGSISVTGSLTVYFEDNSFVTKVANWTTTNLMIVLQDSAGNAYAIWLPAIKLTDIPVTAAGLNGDVTVTIPFEAFYDPTNGYSIRIARWDA